ncbi:hypothetical protein HDU76_013985 [Blyttiomyces sp. JEL0837]|nr:hypothetical protein HDU76_013985 [Blyttiomyces sp. JEL0837]
MMYNSIPWNSACPSDARYKHYIENRSSFWPIERLSGSVRLIISQILEPNASKRIWMGKILESEWVKSIDCCTAKNPGHHSHSGKCSGV